jgi:hypothetical protein
MELRYKIVINPAAKNFLKCLSQERLSEGEFCASELGKIINKNDEILDDCFSEWKTREDIMRDEFEDQLVYAMYSVRNSYDFSDNLDEFAVKLLEITRVNNFTELEAVFDEKILSKKDSFKDYTIINTRDDEVWYDIKEVIHEYAIYEQERQKFMDYVGKNIGCATLEISLKTTL